MPNEKKFQKSEFWKFHKIRQVFVRAYKEYIKLLFDI